MMTLVLALMAVLDASSVLIDTVTMITVKFLVGVLQDVKIDGDDTNRLDWLGKSMRSFVLHILYL